MIAARIGGAGAALLASACVAMPMVSAPVPLAAPPAPQSIPIAVTSRMDGSVAVVDRDLLTIVREVPSALGGASTWPMQVVADAERRVFYVGNFDGALKKVPFLQGPPVPLDVGGPAAGLALDPRGKLLAVAGVKDLTLRLVNLDEWRVSSAVRLGNAADEVKGGRALTHGVATPHPVWRTDGTAVVVQDNIHEELVLVSRRGNLLARRPMRSAVHTVLVTPSGPLLAIGEGSPDGAAPPHVAVLDPRTLEIRREILVPLPDGEAPTLHHAALSPDGETVVVANMGPVRGDGGVTVAAIRWKTGEVVWTASTVRTAAHVKFLDAARIVVLGHRSAELKILDAATGAEQAVWPVLGTASLGHALDVANDEVTVLDGTLGRVLRFRAGELVGESPRVGDGYAESSLDE